MHDPVLPFRRVSAASTRIAGMHALLLGLTLGALGPRVVWCQAPPGTETLTLTQAVEHALATHPSMQAARAEEEAAHSQVGVARADWMPQLGLQATATRFEKPMLVYPIHGFTPELIPPFSRNVATGTLGLDFTLFDGGERGSRVHAAHAAERGAAASTGAAARELTQRVVATYLQVLGQKQLLEAHDRRLEALRAEHERVRQILDTGRAARVDLLRAEAELNRAEADRVERATALELAERDLARLVGESTLAAARLRPVQLLDTVVASRDSLVAVALQDNGDVQRARASVDEAQARSRGTRASRWPSLGLFARGQAWTDTDGNDTAEWNVGAQLVFPLFTGRERHHRIAAADAGLRQAEARLQVLELEVERRVDTAVSEAEQARARAISLETAVARFDEVQRIRLLALDTGTGTQTDYLDAEADLLDARARLIEARHREIVSRSALAWNTGQLDLEWLHDNLEDR